MAKLTAQTNSILALGRRLRVARWNFSDSAGSKRPLLVFGGIGLNLELLEPVATALGNRPVVSFDMPGVGQSPDPLVPYTAATMALTAQAVLDRMGIDKVDLLGISWGGGIAQQFALQHRNRVGRLVMAATSAGMAMAPGDPRMLARLADPAEYTVPKALQRNLAMLYAGGGETPVSLNAVTPPSPAGFAYQLGALAGWSSVAMLPLLDMPTLVMAGDDDQVVPPVNAQFLHTLIPGSRLEMFAGGGHLFMLSHLAEFAATLEAFLDADGAPAAPA